MEYIPIQWGLGFSGDAEESEVSTGGVEREEMWISGYHSGETDELITDGQ